MSKFTHSICEDCWNKKNPDRPVVKIQVGVFSGERCCYCGNIHNSGIFVRDNPSNCLCKGDH